MSQLKIIFFVSLWSLAIFQLATFGKGTGGLLLGFVDDNTQDCCHIFLPESRSEEEAIGGCLAESFQLMIGMFYEAYTRVFQMSLKVGW